MTAPVLEIDRLTIAIGGQPVVREASLTLKSGEILGLVGESGGGKSILSMSVPGLLPPAARIVSGDVRLNGRSIVGLDEEGRRRLRRDQVGVVFQHPMRALNPRLDLRAQIEEALPGGLARAERRRRALELLDRVGVDRAAERLEQYPHELSGGLAQRVVIGLALARDPALMIADEPTTALDVNVQAQILDLIDRLRREMSLSVLLVSHDLDVIGDRADHVAVLQTGRIVESGPADRILLNPEHPYTARLLAARPTARLAARLAGPPEPEPPAAAPAPGEPPLLEAIGISRTFGRHTPLWGSWHARRPAVREASLSLRAGESLGIVGESGSGKTSLARILIGLERADQGRVLFRGKPVEKLEAEERRRWRRAAQFVFQDSTAALDPRFTVAESLAEPLRAAGFSAEAQAARVLALLDEVGLDRAYAGRKPGQLSGGQRQRVNIARALALDPELIIADEPVSALDVSVQATIIALLLRLQKTRGMASLVISHDLAVIGLLCSRVIVMRRGEIVEAGPVAEVLNAPKHPYARELVEAAPGRRLAGLFPSPRPEPAHAV